MGMGDEKKMCLEKIMNIKESCTYYVSASEPPETKKNKQLGVCDLLENFCIWAFPNAWKWHSGHIKQIAFIWF